ncbi:hypothetical protein NBY12_24490 (plasmid) [Escherichia coli]|uniref:hypothetical protein n=1 Tax=Escherichia coli TaxID=562 RepID=UPI00203012B7|nr:hypothetical protein [Escherichia coli]URV23166.1 hypothetical protein NBY12_24490 [Escherichia coli]
MELKKSHRDVAPMVFERVDETCIADVVSEWTGIPLGTFLETEKEKKAKHYFLAYNNALLVKITLCQSYLLK